MSEPPAAGAAHISEDERILHRLGYAQELFRAMGGFQNFAISFTIISILAGCLTSYYIAFESGGPIAVTWGWLLIGLFSTIIALAMAEIASSFPTAGGLYYWASKLGSPGWGWATGWFNLIGQIAVTAAIGYGLSTFATVIFDGHLVSGRPMSIGDLVSWPAFWNAWLDVQPVPSQLKSEDSFQSNAVQPARRSRIPRPAAPAGVWRRSVDVRGDHIRLDLVAHDFLGRIGMQDGIQEPEEFHGPLAFAQ